jgi:hypothetical protein
MRTHRNGPRIAFRSDLVSAGEVLGLLLLALFFVYLSAVAIGLVVPTGTKRKFEPTSGRLIAGTLAVPLFLALIIAYKHLRQWCEIDHETWTLRFIEGPWLRPAVSTLIREIHLRDIAEVQVDALTYDRRGESHRVLLVLRDGNRVCVPCLKPQSDARAAQADADTLTALLWPTAVSARAASQPTPQI